MDARGGFNPMTSSAGDDLDPIFHSLLSSGLPRYFVLPGYLADHHLVLSYVRTYPLCHVHDLVKFSLPSSQRVFAFSKISSSFSSTYIYISSRRRWNERTNEWRRDSLSGISKRKPRNSSRVLKKSYRNVTNDFNKRNNDDTTITATTP